MRKKVLIASLSVFITASVSAQWKSYYPESKKMKKATKKELKSESSVKFELHFYNALIQKSLDNFEEAIEEFKKCASIKPEKQVTYYQLALIYKITSQHELGLDASKKAYILDKKNIWYELLYAEMLTLNNYYTKAAERYRQIIKKHPGNQEYYHLLAENHIFSGRLTDAIKVYNQIEQHTGFDKNISIQKHKLHLENNNIDKAILEINNIITNDSSDINAYEILAELYLLKNNRKKALLIFNKILELDPEEAKVHLTLANYFREEQQNKKSYYHLKTAFSSVKLSIDIKIQILLSYFSLSADAYNQIKDQALELCLRLINTHKNNPKAYAIYGDFLYKEELYKEAKTQYKKVLEMDKSKSQVWSQILFIEADLKEYKDLKEDSKLAVELFPTNPVYYFFNSIANSQLNNNKEAINSLNAGLEYVLDNNELLIQFYSSMGDIYHALKQHHQSDSIYKLALALDSNNVQVLNNYSYYLSLREENLILALAMSKKSNELTPGNASFQDTYGWIFYQKKDYKNAEIWLSKAFKNGGNLSPVITEHLGDVYYQLGNIEKAKIYWKKAAALGEDSIRLRNKITSETIDE